MSESFAAGAARSSDEESIGPRTVRKVAWRITWFVMALYFLAILDRGNVSFAALQMNQALGLTSEMFGFAVGIMYFTYALFEVPSNLILARIGARLTLTRIAILWGIATILMAFTQGPLSLYVFRGFLGIAESGLFPGVMLLLSLWFPFSYRARYNAMFNYAVPISYVFASLISGLILELDGKLGIPGWKWLFLIEGTPPILLGLFGFFYLTDVPSKAAWLTQDERAWLQKQLDSDTQQRAVVHADSILKTLLKPTVLLLGLCNFGLFCGLATLFPWLPLLVKTFGLTSIQIGFVTAIPSLIGLGGMIILSRWSDRLQERFYFTIFTMMIAAVGFVIAGFAAWPPLIILGFAVANVGVYGTQAVFWTIPQSYLSRDIAPGAIGLIGMIGSIGGATIPVVIGRIKDATHSLTGGFMTVSLIFVAAACLVLYLRSGLVRT